MRHLKALLFPPPEFHEAQQPITNPLSASPPLARSDAEIERVQTVEGAAPIAAAVAADAVAHSIPGLNLLFGLLTEPAGAACGVAYMMTLVRVLLDETFFVDAPCFFVFPTVMHADRAHRHRL